LAITSSDIKIRLSGGAANADVNLSLGGAKSTVEVVDNTLINLFDNVDGTESTAGDIEYRCVYIHNNHGSLTMQNVRVYISSNTTSADDTWTIGLGTAAINATEQTIPDENTAPTGVTFSAPTDYAGGLASADIPPSQHRSVWYKRIVNATAAAIDANAISLKFDCDTAA
jgi:hypothetical protein